MRLRDRPLWVYITIDVWLFHKATAIENYFHRKDYLHV